MDRYYIDLTRECLPWRYRQTGICAGLCFPSRFTECLAGCMAGFRCRTKKVTPPYLAGAPKSPDDLQAVAFEAERQE